MNFKTIDLEFALKELELTKERKKTTQYDENFLEKTIKKIKEIGHKTDDIVFIGSLKTYHSCTWDEFVILANFVYENCTFAKIAEDLEIIFKNGSRLIRDEYEGFDGWIFIRHFSKRKKTKKIYWLKSLDTLEMDLAQIQDLFIAANNYAKKAKGPDEPTEAVAPTGNPQST